MFNKKFALIGLLLYGQIISSAPLCANTEQEKTQTALSNAQEQNPSEHQPTHDLVSYNRKKCNAKHNSSFPLRKRANPATQNRPRMHNHTFLLEGKASFFSPTDSKIRNIYTKGTGLYGIESSVQAWRRLYPWISGSILSVDGRSKHFHHRTNATLVPLGAGIKLLHNFTHANVYLGIGALYSYLHMHDHSPYVISSISQWTWGGIAKLGICVFPTNALFIDFFADYSYMKFPFHNGHGKVYRSDVNFSGWSTGAGIGFAI